MNPRDPLEALHPLRTPPPVDAWPPAPGWWLLAALLLAALAALGFLALRTWRRRAHLRAARRELAALRARFADDPAALTAATNALLKRVALARYPRRETAALSGGRWLAFLDATAPAQPDANHEETARPRPRIRPGPYFGTLFVFVAP